MTDRYFVAYAVVKTQHAKYNKEKQDIFKSSTTTGRDLSTAALRAFNCFDAVRFSHAPLIVVTRRTFSAPATRGKQTNEVDFNFSLLIK